MSKHAGRGMMTSLRGGDPEKTFNADLSVGLAMGQIKTRAPCRSKKSVLYVNGNALESCLRSENYVAIKPWKCEAEDTTLLEPIPFLKYVKCHSPADIRPLLASYEGHDITTEFIERFKEHRRWDKRREGWSVILKTVSLGRKLGLGLQLIGGIRQEHH